MLRTRVNENAYGEEDNDLETNDCLLRLYYNQCVYLPELQWF